MRGLDNDEIALRGQQQIRQLNVTSYQDFVHSHETFLVVYSQVFWPALVRALQRDGYCRRWPGPARPSCCRRFRAASRPPPKDTICLRFDGE